MEIRTDLKLEYFVGMGEFDRVMPPIFFGLPQPHIQKLKKYTAGVSLKVTHKFRPNPMHKKYPITNKDSHTMRALREFENAMAREIIRNPSGLYLEGIGTIVMISLKIFKSNGYKYRVMPYLFQDLKNNVYKIRPSRYLNKLIREAIKNNEHFKYFEIKSTSDLKKLSKIYDKKRYNLKAKKYS